MFGKKRRNPSRSCKQRFKCYYYWQATQGLTVWCVSVVISESQDGFNDEMMTQKLELFIPETLTVFYIKKGCISAKLNSYISIISRILESHESIEVWSGLLMTNLREAFNDIPNVITRSNDPSPTSRGTFRELHPNAARYVKSVQGDLNKCLDSANMIISQTECILTLSHALIKFLSGDIPITTFIPLAILFCAIPHCFQYLTLPLV